MCIANQFENVFPFFTISKNPDPGNGKHGCVCVEVLTMNHDLHSMMESILVSVNNIHNKSCFVCCQYRGTILEQSKLIKSVWCSPKSDVTYKNVGKSTACFQCCEAPCCNAMTKCRKLCYTIMSHSQLIC